MMFYVVVDIVRLFQMRWTTPSCDAQTCVERSSLCLCLCLCLSHIHIPGIVRRPSGDCHVRILALTPRSASVLVTFSSSVNTNSVIPWRLSCNSSVGSTTDVSKLHHITSTSSNMRMWRSAVRDFWNKTTGHCDGKSRRSYCNGRLSNQQITMLNMRSWLVIQTAPPCPAIQCHVLREHMRFPHL